MARHPASILLFAVLALQPACATGTPPAANGPTPELSLPSGTELSGLAWNRRGTLSLFLRLEGIDDTRELDLKKGEYLGVKFLRGPAFDLQLFFTGKGAGGFGILFTDTDGKEKRVNAPLVHLRGDQTYHVAVNWDLDTQAVEVFYNGIPQGDIGHWGGGGAGLVLHDAKPTILDGRFAKDPTVRLLLGGLAVFPEPLDAAAVAALPGVAALEPLSSEGRVTYGDRSLDLAGYETELIYAVDFSKPQTIARESALFENGRRVREPSPQTEWVLEGMEGMVLETREDGLHMETPDPADRKNGHWVLWANRVFPDDILIEYRFTPRSDRQGLNILFFAARSRDGGSIFDPKLPYRGGKFREYIVGEIDSYHISPWATDDKDLRATSNMRKNSGFHLVARGNDVIGGSGPGPHTVRILKTGGAVRMEADGVLCLAFDDDGKTYGPVLGDGFIGVRFMAHTGSAVLHELKVYRVGPAGIRPGEPEPEPPHESANGAF